MFWSKKSENILLSPSLFIRLSLTKKIVSFYKILLQLLMTLIIFFPNLHLFTLHSFF
jgi:hypothetical protein